MANPVQLCVDIFGSTFTAVLVLKAGGGQIGNSNEYTMTCTGTVQGGPADMVIQDDPCNTDVRQSWTCEILRVRESICEYRLQGSDQKEPKEGSIGLGDCTIPEPFVTKCVKEMF